jgi:hypothetical protein
MSSTRDMVRLVRLTRPAEVNSFLPSAVLREAFKTFAKIVSQNSVLDKALAPSLPRTHRASHESSDTPLQDHPENMPPFHLLLTEGGSVTGVSSD